MKTIKEISGNVLIFLYEQQREVAFNLGSYNVIRFEDNREPESGMSKVNVSAENEFDKKLLITGNDTAADLYNALEYLSEKGFISFRQSRDTGGVSIYGLQMSSGGIDIIEGVERGQEEQKKFYITFNIKLADNINVESLIKTQFDSIFKASVL